MTLGQAIGLGAMILYFVFVITFFALGVFPLKGGKENAGNALHTSAADRLQPNALWGLDPGPGRRDVDHSSGVQLAKKKMSKQALKNLIYWVIFVLALILAVYLVLGNLNIAGLE